MLGFAAGFLTTIAFIPQVHKIWKSKSAEDVSLATFAAFTLGVVLWLLYGIAVVESGLDPAAPVLWTRASRPRSRRLSCAART